MDKASLKRLVVLSAAVLGTFLSAVLRVDVDEDTKHAITVLVSTYLFQSGVRSAARERRESSGGVQ